MADIEITDNTPQFREVLDDAKARALEIIGSKIEDYAVAFVGPLRPKEEFHAHADHISWAVEHYC